MLFFVFRFNSFKGHKGLITQCHFMKSQNILITRLVKYKLFSFVFILNYSCKEYLFLILTFFCIIPLSKVE